MMFDAAETDTIAAALYDGGWRSKDIDQLIKEYSLTVENAAAVCEQIKKWEGE